MSKLLNTEIDTYLHGVLLTYASTHMVTIRRALEMILLDIADTVDYYPADNKKPLSKLGDLLPVKKTRIDDLKIAVPMKRNKRQAKEPVEIKDLMG